MPVLDEILYLYMRSRRDLCACVYILDEIIIRIADIMKYYEVLWGFLGARGVEGLTNCACYAKLPLLA